MCAHVCVDVCGACIIECVCVLCVCVCVRVCCGWFPSQCNLAVVGRNRHYLCFDMKALCTFVAAVL